MSIFQKQILFIHVINAVVLPISLSQPTPESTAESGLASDFVGVGTRIYARSWPDTTYFVYSSCGVFTSQDRSTHGCRQGASRLKWAAVGARYYRWVFVPTTLPREFVGRGSSFVFLVVMVLSANSARNESRWMVLRGLFSPLRRRVYYPHSGCNVSPSPVDRKSSGG